MVNAPRAQPPKRARASSFDHLVGAGEQYRRNFDAECVGGFEVCNQLEARRLLEGQVGGVSTLDYLVHVHGGASTQTRLPQCPVLSCIPACPSTALIHLSLQT